MRTKIRLSTSTQVSPNSWFWWGWEQERPVGAGSVAHSKEKARQALHALVGHQQWSVGRRPPSGL